MLVQPLTCLVSILSRLIQGPRIVLFHLTPYASFLAVFIIKSQVLLHPERVIQLIKNETTPTRPLISKQSFVAIALI